MHMIIIWRNKLTHTPIINVSNEEEKSHNMRPNNAVNSFKKNTIPNTLFINYKTCEIRNYSQKNYRIKH